MTEPSELDAAASAFLKHLRRHGKGVLTKMAYSDAEQTRPIGIVIAVLEQDPEKFAAAVVAGLRQAIEQYESKHPAPVASCGFN